MNLAVRWVSLVVLALIAACADAAPAPASGPRIRLQTVIKGLSSPVDILSDGSAERMFIAEQPGRPAIDDQGQARTDAVPEHRRALSRTRGARDSSVSPFHPQFATNGYFYVNYFRRLDAEERSPHRHR
jgi:glucose/arabinose dehydrogenase